SLSRPSLTRFPTPVLSGDLRLACSLRCVRLDAPVLGVRIWWPTMHDQSAKIQVPRPYPGRPGKQGLYDPQYEHEACGVGFVVDVKGRKSHSIIQQDLQVLLNLNNRGGGSGT